MAMIYLLTGNDSYTKKQAITDMQKLHAAELLNIQTTDPKELLKATANEGLFSQKRIIVVEGFLGKQEDSTAVIDRLKTSDNIYLFIEQNLDKRKTETKKLLANKDITITDHQIPAGEILQKWITKESKKIELNWALDAQPFFIQRIGGFVEADQISYDLWLIHSELQKLKTFAGATAVTKKNVEDLVSENISEDVFVLTNALTDKNRGVAMNLLLNHLERMPGTDEKSKIINLVAILAEQFRGIYMFQGLLSARMLDQELQRISGFSPGRVFIYKKMSGKFSFSKSTRYSYKILNYSMKN